MRTLQNIVRNRRGTSLIEILIALVIMGIVTTAIFELYVTQHQGYIAQEDVTNVQQNGRAAIDEITRHIRMAGHRLPLELDPIEAANTNPDTITLTYRADDCETYLSAPMPQPSSELKCGSDISCFEDGMWAYILEPDSGGGEWFEITHVQAAAYHLQHNTMVLSKAYAADAVVLAMSQIKFYIDNTTDPDHPNLMMEIPGRAPQVFAENIEDLQFRYRMKNGIITDQPVLVDDIREVLIEITARSDHPDYRLASANPSNDPDDYYRRRTFATSVFLRNVGI